MSFTRNCPECGKVLQYGRKGDLNHAIRNECVCKPCSKKGKNNPNYGKPLSEEQKRKLSEASKGEKNHFYGKIHSRESIRKISEASSQRVGEKNPFYGKKHTAETKRKLSEALRGRKPTFYGKKHTIETKRKLRLAAIARMERRGQTKPNYNPKACRLIEEYGKKHGYNFQHAENGGEFHVKELGYWVDGYDAEKNVVIEVDESYHFVNGNLRQKDKQRQQEIEEYLNCKFIRVKV